MWCLHRLWGHQNFSEARSMTLPLWRIDAFSGGGAHTIVLFLVANARFFNRGQETAFFRTPLDHSALVQLVETLRRHAKPVLVDLAIVLTKRRDDTDRQGRRFRQLDRRTEHIDA